MLPEWLAVGLALTGVLAVVFAAVFVAGERLFPTRPVETGERSGEWKRRREIRTYLDAIGESYVENRPVAGHSAAFYLPDRDVAVTFDARAYFRITATDTRAVLAEHEMPGAHIGARLPFETPEVGVGAPGDASNDPDPDRRVNVDAAFAVLGLPPDASLDDVRAAYRERMKEAHPDQGGDPETFRRVRDAYAAARRRAK